MLALFIALLSLVACTPCTSFADMALDDPDTLGPIVADFAAWTGREGVCVPSVEVVGEIAGDPRLAGRFQGAGEPILLAESGDYRAALLHELCHALDEQEGLSADFPDTGEDLGAAYDTPALRRMEGFAQVCEDGPAPVAFQAALEERCEVPTDPAAAWVRTEVYPHAPADPPVSVGPAPQVTRVLAGAPGVIVAAAGEADGAWLRLEGGGEARTVWWSPPPRVGANPRERSRRVPPGRGDWALAGDAVEGPAGDLLWTWYTAGVTGAGVGTAASWELVTDCGAGASGAVPAWVDDAPALFTNVPERAVWRW
jgi:hypothetical protein